MSMLQLLGGVAAAGVVAAGTTALTGTGVSFAGTGTGTSAQYVGGQVTQTVSGGASITGINYTTNTAGDQVTQIQVVVANADGAYLTVTPSQSGGGLQGGADEWLCTGGAAPAYSATAPKILLNSDPATINCVTSLASGPHSVAGYYTGLTGVQLNVTNS
ncbi:MAG TPA: hypothetical protein VFW27_39180 [Actinoplanes sp.]|nr:hypothetical protein [Actinoplanes sp.]